MNRKHWVNGFVALALGLGLSMGAFAQGRHDEKPHGPPKKSSAKQPKKVKQPTVAGRHDEKPHGTSNAKAGSEK